MLKYKIQGTPNPNARKYILSEEVKAKGKVSYKEQSECAHIPLGYYLLGIEGIKQVHFFENVLTLTQDGERNWSELDDRIQTVLFKQMEGHDIFFEESLGKPEPQRKAYAGELRVIDEILDKTIRPSLQLDGGDVHLVELEDNILTISYEGACNECPSSKAGTLAAIEQVLREGYSPDLHIAVLS
jgi:Fe-S cluster biogenesis protein NfuA